MTAITVEQLVALWTGDELSMGYQSASLAEALCRVFNPASADHLGRRLRADYPKGVDAEEVGFVNDGYDAWQRRKTARHTHGVKRD